jgi:hypothetical protein
MCLGTDRAVGEPNFNSLTGRIAHTLCQNWRIYQKDDCSSLLSVLDRNKSPCIHSLNCCNTTMPSGNSGTTGSVLFSQSRVFENIIL